MTKSPVQEALLQNYFQLWNGLDFKARGYIDRNLTSVTSDYENNIKQMTLKQSQTLAPLTTKLNTILKHNGFAQLSSIAHEIWVSYDNIEQNLPHTHGDKIILPAQMISFTSADSLIGILLHERIHIFQRKNPILCNKLYLNFWKFRIHALKTVEDVVSRSNPDITHIIYRDNKGIIKANYKSMEYPSLTNIDDQRDHPNEIMAYLLTAIIMKKQISPYLVEYISGIEKWLKVYATDI